MKFDPSCHHAVHEAGQTRMTGTEQQGLKARSESAAAVIVVMLQKAGGGLVAGAVVLMRSGYRGTVRRM